MENEINKTPEQVAESFKSRAIDELKRLVRNAIIKQNIENKHFRLSGDQIKRAKTSKSTYFRKSVRSKYTPNGIPCRTTKEAKRKFGYMNSPDFKKV